MTDPCGLGWRGQAEQAMCAGDRREVYFQRAERLVVGLVGQEEARNFGLAEIQTPNPTPLRECPPSHLVRAPRVGGHRHRGVALGLGQEVVGEGLGVLAGWGENGQVVGGVDGVHLGVPLAADK